MTTVQEVHSLEEFLRDPQGTMRRLRASGAAEVVNAEGADFVLQNAEAYRRLMEEVEFARHIRSLKRNIEAADAGRVVPAKEALRRIARADGIDRAS